MAITCIVPKKDLFNGGKCFTKDKEYFVNKIILQESGLMEAKVTNDMGETHIIGSWWRDFRIARWNPNLKFKKP